MAWTFNKYVFRPSDIPTGLVGYWKFNNDATATTGANLTPRNTPTYVASGNYWKDAYSADLESGSSQYFDGGDILDMNGKSFTLASWIKPESLGTAMFLFSKGAGGTTGYHLFFETDGTITLKLAATDTTSATAIVVGKHQHLAVSYNSSTTVVNIYLDGNLVKSATNAGSIADVADLFFIGAKSNTAGNGFDGLVSDAAVWESVLTPLQIKSLALGVDLSKYAYRPNNVSTQPTHWWKLNEVSGDRADSIGSLTFTDTNTVPAGGGYIEGTGADFNGTDDYLSAADNDAFHLSNGNFTCSVWVNIDAYTGASNIAPIFEQQVGTDASHIHLLWAAGGTVEWIEASSGISLTTASLISVGTNTWHHIACRRSGNTTSLWVDGIKADEDTDTGTMENLAAPFLLGKTAIVTTPACLNGRLCDFAWWKGYALTDAEIKSLACALPIQQTGIVAYSKMNAAWGNETSEIGSLTLVDNNTVGTGTGKVGNARDFEAGNTEYFEIANVDAIDIVSDMAILGWHKPEAIDITQTIVDKDYAGDGYGIRIGTDEKVNFYIGNDTDVSTTLAVAGTWLHFCGNYDGALKAVYMNGVLEGNGAYSTNPTDTTTALRIGSTIAGGDYADGLIDEWLLSKRYFRPEEIKAAYLKGLNEKEVTSTERPIGNNSQVIWIS